VRDAGFLLRALLALAVAGGGLWLALRPPETYPDLTEQPATQAEALARRLLRSDPANPYRWCDLGEALAETGKIAEARLCFRRAVELGPNIPPVLMRAAGFHIRVGEARTALPHMLRILELVPDYDAIIFYYTDRLIPFDELLPQLARNPRAARSHFRFLLQSGDAGRARAAWHSLCEHRLANDELAAAYLELLLRKAEYHEALATWVAWLGPRAGDYPVRNLVYNGSFENEPSGSPLDWRIRPLEGVQAVRDPARAREGRASLKLSFPGTANFDYSHVSQLVVVPAGRYRLSAWIASQDLTTDQGLFLRLSETGSGNRVLAETQHITGTTDWQFVEAEVVAPRTLLAAIQLCRRPSRKFDNKIRGAAWVDAVRLERRP
jgi:hypothetical protein